MVNGLRGTAHPFAWQVQHLESLGAASGAHCRKAVCLLHVDIHDVHLKIASLGVSMDVRNMWRNIEGRGHRRPDYCAAPEIDASSDRQKKLAAHCFY